MTPPSRKKAWLGLLLRVGGSAAVLALLFRFLPVDELWLTMRRVPAPVWLAVLGALNGLHLLAIIKWRMMVNLAGAGLSYRQAARCYYAGLFANLFLPSLVGGDLVRAGFALKLGRSKAGVVLGHLIDRMLDFAGMAALATLGVLLIPGALDPQLARRFWTVLGTLAAGGVFGLALAGLLLRRRFSFKMRRRLVKLRTAFRLMAQRPWRVLLALGLALTFQGSLVLLMTRVAVSCGLYVPLAGWLFAYPMAKLSALVPLTQAGIGVREAALAALLVPFGAPQVLSVAAGLVWETLAAAMALLAGFYTLLATRLSSEESAAPAEVSAEESSAS